MSCKPFNKSEDNAKSYLRTKGAIDKFLNIIDINKFRINVNTLTKQAKDKYNIDKGPLFTERTIMSKEKSYYQAVSNDEAFIAINKVSKPNIYFQLEEPKVNFDLKVVNKLQSNISKVNGWFKQMKDTDAFWKKVQSDLAIPKEQVELLRQSEGDTIEQKLVDFVSKYSYTVEINTAKTNEDKQVKQVGDNEEFTFKGSIYEYKNNEYLKDDEIIGLIEYETAKNDAFTNPNTAYYSNLTVPGGTNYTENEISTPGITPSIKGHAQFATDKGIGWFRSDDKIEFLDKKDLIRKGIIKQVPCG